MKWLILLLALPCLSACDGDDVPAQPGPPTPPEVRSSPSNSESAPLPSSVDSEDSVPPKIEIELEPVTAGDPEKLPSERVVPDHASEPVASVAPEKAPKKIPVEKVDLPEPELDLSLPEDWSEQIEPDQEAAAMNLLPPLFESGGNDRSLQMSGRLLPGLEQDEAPIDGAQINFELKR